MRILIFFLFFSFFLSLPSAFKRLTGGFRIEKMQIDYPYNPEWETTGEIAEAKEILSQPFYYLDRGSQCYVFASLDGEYVIKIFRFDQRKILSRLFPDKNKTDFDMKAARLLNASKLAYDRVPEETGLVYIHLNAQSQGLPVLHCKDALGRSYHLPLDKYRFVLQKKVEPFRQSLLKNLQNPEEMKKSIDSIFVLLVARTAKGLRNTDSNLSRNLGFLDGRAIEIDFGNYCDCRDFDLPSRRIREINRFGLPLRAWIKERAPEWVPYIDERMEKVKKEILAE